VFVRSYITDYLDRCSYFDYIRNASCHQIDEKNLIQNKYVDQCIFMSAFDWFDFIIDQQILPDSFPRFLPHISLTPFQGILLTNRFYAVPNICMDNSAVYRTCCTTWCR
jgi:hypothetical protein